MLRSSMCGIVSALEFLENPGLPCRNTAPGPLAPLSYRLSEDRMCVILSLEVLDLNL
jgi:hypothetical protein